MSEISEAWKGEISEVKMSEMGEAMNRFRKLRESHTNR